MRSTTQHTAETLHASVTIHLRGWSDRPPSGRSEGETLSSDPPSSPTSKWVVVVIIVTVVTVVLVLVVVVAVVKTVKQRSLKPVSASLSWLLPTAAGEGAAVAPATAAVLVADVVLTAGTAGFIASAAVHCGHLQHPFCRTREKHINGAHNAASTHTHTSVRTFLFPSDHTYLVQRTNTPGTAAFYYVVQYTI